MHNNGVVSSWNENLVPMIKEIPSADDTNRKLAVDDLHASNA